MLVSKVLSALLLIGLLLTGMAGFVVLADYSSRPGPTTSVLTTLPDDGIGVRDNPSRDVPTIIVFYHPKCPCSFATTRCLQRLRTTFTTQPEILAYAFCPNGETETWISSRTTEVFEATGSNILVDFNGDVCRRFGAAVSGHVLVYDRSGKLIFSGGITPSRGHEGDCLASSQFVRCVNGETVKFTQWPVFGCLIDNRAMEAKNDRE